MHQIVKYVIDMLSNYKYKYSLMWLSSFFKACLMSLHQFLYFMKNKYLWLFP